MNETTYDNDGNVIYYKYFREENNQIIVDDNGTDREPTEEELETYLEEQAELAKQSEKDQAKAVIEQAKQSDNPDIANLADAFSKLLGE